MSVRYAGMSVEHTLSLSVKTAHVFGQLRQVENACMS